MKHLTKIRVLVWEFEWITEVEETIVHPDIQGRYFYSPQGHHQGMFIVLMREQLIAWKIRGSLCLFDKPTRRYGFHRERTSGAMDLCYMTQMLPLGKAFTFTICRIRIIIVSLTKLWPPWIYINVVWEYCLFLLDIVLARA